MARIFIINKLSFICTLLLLIALPGVIRGEEEKPATEIITVIGRCTLNKEDAEKSKEAAIADGLASAVEQAALKLLPLEWITKNFQKFNQLIPENTKDFIETYKLLSEYESGDTYRLMAEVTVLVDKLKEQLSIPDDKEKKQVMPKVLLLIAEQNIRDILPQYWWGETKPSAEFIAEEEIVRVLKEKGFSIIEHGTKIPNMDMAESAVIYKSYLDGYEGVEIGGRFQADVVVVGKAIAQESLSIVGEETKTYTGTITVRAFRTDTGEEITSVSKTAVKNSANELSGGKDALSGAGTLVGEALASQIAYAWEEKVRESDGMTILVTGTSHLGNFVMLRKALNEIPNVNAIQIREMKANEAVIGVDTQEDAQSLANALLLKTFEAFAINIHEVKHNRLRIELVTK